MRPHLSAMPGTILHNLQHINSVYLKSKKKPTTKQWNVKSICVNLHKCLSQIVVACMLIRNWEEYKVSNIHILLVFNAIIFRHIFKVIAYASLLVKTRHFAIYLIQQKKVFFSVMLWLVHFIGEENNVFTEMLFVIL